MTEKSKVIFGNPMTVGTYNKAVKSKKKYAKKFGDDSAVSYRSRLKKMHISVTPWECAIS